LILEAVVFFSIALATTTLFALRPRAIRERFWAAIPRGAAALALAGWLASLALQDPTASVVLGSVIAVTTVAVRLWQRRWSWMGAQLFSIVVFASVAYLVYAALISYTSDLPFIVVALSTVLLLVELFALLLTTSYAFEIVDVLSTRDPSFIRPMPQSWPTVALQVATYNEPVDIVRRTLESLASVGYPHLIVQVVDNNTKDPALWQPLQAICTQLGPRFQFMHLENWPGYKAGALNEATRRLPPEVSILGIIDADYVVAPNFLMAMVGHFEDPTVAFAQSSQNYRDWTDNRYLRGLFFSFRYFFDVTMRARAHRNAIIFCGTMGLIRRSVLEEIGGWSETCITEDAEASLRMLGRGYRGVYDRDAYGAGLMPLDFDGLKKQRYRWCLGGIQILRQWWRELLPVGRHQLKLTTAQRLHYLFGSLQWFGEPLTLLFTVLLLATALTTSLHHQLPVRQLTGAVLVVPIAFAVTGLIRALWAMRLTTRCTAGDAVRALRIWFALSWVVTLACVRGLVTDQAEFLRTPKRKDAAKFLQALRASRAETLLGLAAIAGAAAMILRAPAFTTVALAVLLLFEGFVYTSAPVASLAAESIQLNAERKMWLQSSQNTGDRPERRPGQVASAAVAIAAVAAIAIGLLVVASPPDQAPFTSNGGANLPTIGNVTNPSPASSPATSPSPSAASSVSPSPSSSPSAAPSATPAPTAAATPSPPATP
jgi:hypothetical protein